MDIAQGILGIIAVVVIPFLIVAANELGQFR